MKAAEVWKKAKAEMPETLTMPLRFAMLHSMLQIWHERMKVAMQSPESIANAKEMLILDGDCRVPYLQYNAQEKKMMIKTDRAPMEFQEVLTALETLQTLTILPLTVLRFHSTRRMEQDLKGETLANGSWRLGCGRRKRIRHGPSSVSYATREHAESWRCR